jgi:Spy/CpxP family protein refolding chaperone
LAQFFYHGAIVKTFNRKWFAVLTLMLVPALSQAQNRPQQGGPGGAGGGGGQMGPLLQVIKQLDLTQDQQTSMREIMQQAQSDVRDAMGDLQNATPQERAQKMQDIAKIMSDAREKAEAVLTPEQKAKYYPLMAKAIVAQAGQRLKLLKTAAGKQDLTDDEKTQMDKLFDQDQKALDGLTADAADVKDADGLTELQKKVETTQQDTRKQLVEILGPDGAQQLMQAMRQNGTRRPGGAGGDAAGKSAPTTKPSQE